MRYTPKGEEDFVVALSISQPTCLAFGGPQMDRLFVTSAHQGLSAEARAEQPEAGNLFVFQTDTKGIQDPLFEPDIAPARKA